MANYGDAPQTLTITPSFRFENDETNGAVQVHCVAAERCRPRRRCRRTGNGDLRRHPEHRGRRILRDWTANSGGNGANPAPLDLLEYDGYVELDNEAVDPLHLAWHVLPRQSGETSSADDTVEHHRRDRMDSVRRHHAEQRRPERHADRGLLAHRRELAARRPATKGAGLPTVDLRYAGVQTIPVPARLLLRRPVLPPAVRREHMGGARPDANAPASFEWDIDTNQDGEADYAVFNLELGRRPDRRSKRRLRRRARRRQRHRASSSPTTPRTARTPC